MAFRFPHPFENVGDAIKDALDPDTPSDGSLVAQLMNENNRAVEDALRGQPSASYHRFTHSGVVTLDEQSPPFVSPYNTTLIGARCDVAAGSDDATVGVYIDGSLVGSISWSSAPTSVAMAFSEALTADSSRLTVAFTAGTGSASISIRFEVTL